MAVLSNADRAEVWARFMRDPFGTVAILKAQIRAAVDAADDWAESNATSYNTAIPQPARSSLTSKQKAVILAYVVLRRHEVI